MKIESARYAKALISYHDTAWQHKPEYFNLNEMYSNVKVYE